MPKSTFWMERKKIEELSRWYNLSSDELEDFLQFFTSFGSILYTHDVPSLKKYVIIDIARFVKDIHDLYHSQEESAKYGLFKDTSNQDRRIVFEFLTTLGIAAEVKSSQIVPQDDLDVEIATTYYYIPTSRKPLAAHLTPHKSSWTTCDSGSFNLLACRPDEYTQTKETLQAILCRHLLFNKRCFLVPTASKNTTTIRFFDEDQKEYDIGFIDNGKQLQMRLVNEEQKGNVQVADAFSLMVKTTCPFFRSTNIRKMSRSDLVGALKNTKCKEGTIV